MLSLGCLSDSSDAAKAELAFRRIVIEAAFESAVKGCRASNNQMRIRTRTARFLAPA
jgi:hypothetical protein